MDEAMTPEERDTRDAAMRRVADLERQAERARVKLEEQERVKAEATQLQEEAEAAVQAEKAARKALSDLSQVASSPRRFSGRSAIFNEISLKPKSEYTFIAC